MNASKTTTKDRYPIKFLFNFSFAQCHYKSKLINRLDKDKEFQEAP